MEQQNRDELVYIVMHKRVHVVVEIADVRRDAGERGIRERGCAGTVGAVRGVIVWKSVLSGTTRVQENKTKRSASFSRVQKILFAPDEGDVDAEAAVDAAAVEAQEDAVVHRRPLRVARVAVRARLLL
jgi:hypothetical protein